MMWSECCTSYANSLHVLDTYKDIDIVCEAGGLAGFYATGVFGLLYELCKQKKITIHTLYGASTGAIGGCLFMTALHTTDENIKRRLTIDSVRSMYDQCKDEMKKGKKICDAFVDVMISLLPRNAHELCSGRLYITVTEVTYTCLPIHRRVISHFDTFDDLIQVIRCSASVPYLTINRMYTEWKGKKYIDGISPLYRHGHDPLVVINLSSLGYPLHYSLNPTDPYIDLLVLRGIIDAKRFMEDGTHTSSLHVLTNSTSPLSLPYLFSKPILRWSRRIMFVFLFFHLVRNFIRNVQK